MLLLATDLFPPLHIAVEVALVLSQRVGHHHPLLQSEEGHDEVVFQSVAVVVAVAADVVVAEEGEGGMDHRLGCNLRGMKGY